MTQQSPEPDVELVRTLTTIIRTIAGLGPVAPSVIRSELQRVGIERWSITRRTKGLIRLAEDYRAKAQFGRFKGTLLLGVADLGNSFLTDFERSGLLLSQDESPRRYGEFLTALETELSSSPEPVWQMLQARIRTYNAFSRLEREVTRRDGASLRRLAARLRHIIKKVLSLVNLAFLNQ